MWWIVLIMAAVLFPGVIRMGIRLAWGTVKFFLGLGLFAFCPVLFAILVILGFYGYGLIPMILLVIVLGRLFRRA